MSPVKITLFLALVLISCCAFDLLLVVKFHRVRKGTKGFAAIRNWSRERRWYLGGVVALYLVFNGVLFGTDLIHLPGLRYESRPFVISANRYLQQRKFREAALELRNALVKNPDDHEVRLTLARILHLTGRYQEAEVEYRAVIAAVTSSPDARLGLARLLLATTRREAALSELREAIRLKPDSAEPHLLLSRILRTDGAYPQAVEESRLALAASPDRLEIREQHIATALEGGLFAEALREAEILRQREPKNLKVWGYQALALHGLGRTGEADALLREAAAGDRQAAAPWFYMGDLLLCRKEYSAALRCYDEGLKREPHNNMVLNNVAALTTDLLRAHTLAAYLNWKYPKNPDYADTLGWVLVKQDKPVQALPYLRTAVAGLPQNPEYRYHLGMALLKTGNRDAGRKELETAFRLASDFNGAAQARVVLASATNR